jgi:hypothetical protein
LRPALGKDTNSFSEVSPEGLEERQRRRAGKVGRYGILTKMWSDANMLERVRKCRKVSVAPAGSVGVRHRLGVAGYSGLAKCGSVWACPVCAAKIARERASDLQAVLSWAVSHRHTVAMLTATVQHHAGHNLNATWDAVQYAWASILRSRLYKGESDREYQKRLDTWVTKGRFKGKPRPTRHRGWKERYGELGWVRAVECTHGEDNGWHPHLHVVFVFQDQLSGDLIRAAVVELFPVWQRALTRHGYDAREHWTNPDGSTGGALDVRVSTEETAAGLVEYFTKFVALEVTNAVNKRGKRGGRTPFQLAHAAYVDGEADAYDAWVEWTKVSHGRRQLTWSAGLRELAGLSKEERSDEEIAEDNLGDEDELVLPAETWLAIRDHQVELLLATEDGGIPAAIAWLEARGLEWIGRRPGKPSPSDRSPPPRDNV